MSAALENRAVAVALARQGIAIHPCRSSDSDELDHEGTPKRRAKSAIIKGWNKLATSSIGQVDAWWRGFPDAVPAIHIGMAGFVGIDCDRKSGKADGVAAFLELCASHGYSPPEPVQTPSGGHHYYFRAPDGIGFGNKTGALPDGVDVRSGNGYMIAPGSVLANGGTYTDLDLANPAELPRWLIELMLARPEKAQMPASTAHPHIAVEAAGNSRYIEKALNHELDIVRTKAEPGRNTQLNNSVLKIAHYVGGAHIARGLVEAEFYKAGRACGLEHDETEKTIQSALNFGVTQPKTRRQGMSAHPYCLRTRPQSPR